MLSVRECEKAIKPMLTEARFHHSVCVAKEAKRLAKLYGADEKKAEVAGMLHDIVKDTPKEEQLKIIDGSDIIMSTTERAKPQLWHAIAGAVYVRDTLGLDDAEIFEAIRWHTSAKAGMSLFDKVLFIADFTSEERDYEGVQEMRDLAEQSLDLAMIEGIRFTVMETMSSSSIVCARSIDAYNDAVLSFEEKRESLPLNSQKEQQKTERKVAKVQKKVVKKLPETKERRRVEKHIARTKKKEIKNAKKA